MAKSGRSSTRKANNRRLASTVFGPAETARAERLSAKLLEVAQQPKPTTSDAEMDEIVDVVADANEPGDGVAMDVDRKVSSNRNNRKIIGKRKQKKASIVFPKYSDRLKAKKNKKKA
ncbi:hypothetical protein NQ176_g1136 [Zarea fungicola]|uniref:Uncharacterized protein n=1 Tax=Zarea fungicola TaxID=93591 RepID=A0ACC1NU02_9HYPO|nr:hypothetical protein NQ176_g1136 [Lecanicillium fungicola]